MVSLLILFGRFISFLFSRLIFVHIFLPIQLMSMDIDSFLNIKCTDPLERNCAMHETTRFSLCMQMQQQDKWQIDIWQSSHFKKRFNSKTKCAVENFTFLTPFHDKHTAITFELYFIQTGLTSWLISCAPTMFVRYHVRNENALISMDSIVAIRYSK